MTEPSSSDYSFSTMREKSARPAPPRAPNCAVESYLSVCSRPCSIGSPGKSSNHGRTLETAIILQLERIFQIVGDAPLCAVVHRPEPCGGKMASEGMFSDGTNGIQYKTFSVPDGMLMEPFVSRAEPILGALCVLRRRMRNGGAELCRGRSSRSQVPARANQRLSDEQVR